jgi:hypothetical protein
LNIAILVAVMLSATSADRSDLCVGQLGPDFATLQVSVPSGSDYVFMFCSVSVGSKLYYGFAARLEREEDTMTCDVAAPMVVNNRIVNKLWMFGYRSDPLKAAVAGPVNPKVRTDLFCGGLK